MEDKIELSNYYIKLLADNKLNRGFKLKNAELLKIDKLYKELREDKIPLAIDLAEAIIKYAYFKNIGIKRLSYYSGELLRYYHDKRIIDRYERMLFMYMATVVLSYDSSDTFRIIRKIDDLPPDKLHLANIIYYMTCTKFNNLEVYIDDFENKINDYYENKYNIVINLNYVYYEMLYRLGRIKYFIKLDSMDRVNKEYKEALELLLLKPAVRGFKELFLMLNREYLNYIYRYDLSFNSLKNNEARVDSEYVDKIPSTSIYDYEGSIKFNTTDSSITLDYVSYYHIYMDMDDYNDYALIMEPSESSNGLIFLRGINNTNTSFRYVDNLDEQLKYLDNLIDEILED